VQNAPGVTGFEDSVGGVSSAGDDEEGGGVTGTDGVNGVGSGVPVTGSGPPAGRTRAGSTTAAAPQEPSRMRRIAERSRGSTVRPHRYFTAIQRDTYSQRTEATGNHSAGSRSDFERFTDAVTARNDHSYPRSFANASRVDDVHA
jgi:hypothetical protein